MNAQDSCFKLNNGYAIPLLGYGTWQTPDGDAAVNAVIEAVRAGYRHIDTAAIYKNERGVGEGIRRSTLPRESLFVTSKLWNSERGYDKTMRAFEQSLSDLVLDYLDLYLIHWPANKLGYDDPDSVNLSTWKALCELYSDGRIKAIGVSNFLAHHLAPLMQTEIPPMVNQIEYHPGYIQPETVDFCNKNGILVEAQSPLGRGGILNEPTLAEIAKKHGKTTAQVCIRFCIQNKIVPLPKSVTPARIKENSEVFDFTLDAEDMAAIASLPECGWSGLHPDTFGR